MDIVWTVTHCPVYGGLGEQLIRDSERMPEPWRSHARSCLSTEAITSTRTLVALGLRRNGSVVCSAWVSLPDTRFVPASLGAAFLQHVNVAADCRRNGLGARVVEFACTVVRSHGIKRVLLAASDPSVRAKFYARIGFQPMMPDPWLMFRDLESREPSPGRNVDRAQQVPTVLRAGSVHDLATVQSLCAQPHWQCSIEGTRCLEVEECEEEFCNQFVNSEALVGERARQFLIRNQAGPGKFVSWSKLEADTWSHRLLLENGSENLAREISDSLVRVLEGLWRRSDEELRLYISVKQLLAW